MNNKNNGNSNLGQKQKEELAKKIGISLNDIEQVRIDNGKEFFKYVDPEDKSVKMVENIDYNTNLSKSFKNIQQELSFAQGTNENKNAKEIFDYNMRHKNIEVELIPLIDLKNNRSKYKRQIDSLSTIDRKKIITLLKYNKELELEYININNAIALDKNKRVIDLNYNYAENKAIIKSAEVISYSDKKELNVEEELTVELSDSDFDSIVDEIIVASDNPEITPAKEINVSGNRIDVEEVKKFIELPEAVDRISNPKKKGIMNGLVAAYNRRKMKLEKQNTNTNKKVKVLEMKKKNNNHGNAA